MDILQELNPDLFGKEEDRKQYMLVYLGAVIMFFTWYYFAHYVLINVFEVKLYMELEFH